MANRFGLRHASTGDIFRAALSDGSELGHAVKGYLDAGLLVPDELTSRVVEQRVVDACEGYILDGYPRTLAQAEHLDAMLARRRQGLDSVVYFDLPDEEAVARLTGRRTCSSCGANFHVEFMPPKTDGVCDKCGGALQIRSDSAEDIVRRRLAEYHEKTKPLVAFYEERDLIEHVSALPGPDEVGEATAAVLSRVRNA
jgi:adenylate kinase